MTKGSKIWLWILMIAGGFSAIAGLAAMKYSAGTGILAVIIGSCQIAGAALLLFKQKKEGFYLICVIAVVDFIYSMINHTSILMALIRLIGMPGITYLLLYRNSGDKNQKMSAENPDVVPVQNASTNSNMESTARASRILKKIGIQQKQVVRKQVIKHQILTERKKKRRLHKILQKNPLDHLKTKRLFWDLQKKNGHFGRSL